MQRLSSYRLISVILFFSLFSLSTQATPQKEQENITRNAQNQQIHIPYTQSSITIDGELNEATWQEAKSISLDLVNSPWENLPSPVKTTAKVIENGKYLYVAFIAYDPEPEKIQGFLGDRDTKWSDDIVGIKIDTHNNRRLNYEFFVNPFGVQNDAIFSEITAEANTLWDGIWHSFGKVTEQGYQVEMAIPYNILNFDENGLEKKWAIELVRLYPRESTLRISHIPLDRDNSCWLCQYPEAIGFKHAETGKNIRLTPTVTASKNQQRDIYNLQDGWQDKNDIQVGADLRWGINANNSINATINPDFSNVEADAGQLSINKTFSLFYDEKRAFFLDNSDYFDSNYDLVYTRNIAAPDYGAKLTGRSNKHSYGVFLTNDSETNFFMPGNLSSDIASLNQESHSSALRYRFDQSDNLSLGAIATLRQADNYHNYLTGFDGKYHVDDSNSFRAQLLTSQTEYPEDLYQSFCLGDECSNSLANDCSFGNCAFSEQVHRSKITGEFSDQAVKLDFDHKSEHWDIHIGHEDIGEDFRADLGYMPQIDMSKSQFDVNYFIYSDGESPWQAAIFSADWFTKNNQNNEFIEQTISGTFEIDGPKQSLLEIKLAHSEKVGLRHDDSTLAIEGNSTKFTENQLNIYAHMQPHSRVFTSLEMTLGDKIDYNNDRLGTLQEITAEFVWNITNHLELNLTHTFSQLDADNPQEHLDDNVYSANLTDMRLSYQFDVQSYLKLSMVYTDIHKNTDNNPYNQVSAKNKDLAMQLIYAYKLNPQTVFFLGYSDSSYQDDDLSQIRREQRTFFTKLSYAWMP